MNRHQQEAVERHIEANTKIILFRYKYTVFEQNKSKNKQA